MNWKEFKDAILKAGVRDDDELQSIEIDSDCKALEIFIEDEDGNYASQESETVGSRNIYIERDYNEDEDENHDRVELAANWVTTIPFQIIDVVGNTKEAVTVTEISVEVPDPEQVEARVVSLEGQGFGLCLKPLKSSGEGKVILGGPGVDMTIHYIIVPEH